MTSPIGRRPRPWRHRAQGRDGAGTGARTEMPLVFEGSPSMPQTLCFPRGGVAAERRRGPGAGRRIGILGPGRRDKPAAVPLARRLTELGFHLVATGGTCRHLRDQELEVRRINKVPEGRPHCVDAIISGDFDLVVNTTEGARSVADSFSIRRSASHPRRSLLHHHGRRLGRRRRHRGAGERKA